MWRLDSVRQLVPSSSGVVAVELLTTRLPSRPLPVRLLGFGVSGLDSSASQGQLFDQGERQKLRQLDEVADRIQEQFGRAALRRGSGLEHQAQHKPRPRPEA